MHFNEVAKRCLSGGNNSWLQEEMSTENCGRFTVAMNVVVSYTLAHIERMQNWGFAGGLHFGCNSLFSGKLAAFNARTISL